MGPRAVLRHPAFYSMMTAQCLMSFVIGSVNFHWFSYFTGKGISESVAVSTVAFSAFVSIPVSLVAGFLAERFHVRYILAATHVGFTLAFGLMLFANTVPLAYVFAFCLGCTSGISFTVGQIVFADYYGRNSLGAIRGMVAPINSATNALGPLMAAIAFDLLGNYTLIVVIFAAFSAAAAALWVISTPPKRLHEVPKAVQPA